MLWLPTLLPLFRTDQKEVGRKERVGPHQLYFHLTYTGVVCRVVLVWRTDYTETIYNNYSSLVGTFVVRMFGRVGGFHARQSGKYTPNLPD